MIGLGSPIRSATSCPSTRDCVMVVSAKCASLGTALGPAPADSAAAAVKSPGQPEQPWRPKVGLALLDVWNSLLFYDAALAVAALDDAAAIPPESARGLLQKWVELAPDAAPGLGRKLAALGLSSALSLSPPPPRLAAARPALLAALVAVLGKCRSQDADDGDDDEDDFAVADADDIENSEEEEEEDDDDDDDAEQVDAAALGSGAGQRASAWTAEKGRRRPGGEARF